MTFSNPVSKTKRSSRTSSAMRILCALIVFTLCMVLNGGLTPSLKTVMKANAHIDGGYLGDVPLTTEAIAIDGVKDPVYKNGLTVAVKFEKNYAPVEATGVVTLLYSDGFLYAFYEVNDADLCEPDPELQKSSPWRTDSCEIFINEKNSASENDVIQYRIDCSGWPCTYTRGGLADYGPGAASKHFEFAEADKPGGTSSGSDLDKSGTGYCAEFKIPLEAAKNAGDAVKGFDSPADTAPVEIGVNFQINDVNSSDGNLTWATVYSEYYGTGTDSWDVFAYPYVTIAHYATASGSGLETRATQAPDQPSDPTATEPGSDLDNSNTDVRSGNGTLWLVLGIVACVAAVAAIVIAVLAARARKRSK